MENPADRQRLQRDKENTVKKTRPDPVTREQLVFMLTQIGIEMILQIERNRKHDMDKSPALLCMRAVRMSIIKLLSDPLEKRIKMQTAEYQKIRQELFARLRRRVERLVTKLSEGE
jgi:hypothetical protein